jgi:OOP family OmpA-OmpF porin
MVPSSPPPTDPPPTDLPTPSPGPRSPGLLYGLLVLLFRLLLLGVGGAVAVLAGIGLALWRPGTVADPPLLEWLVRQGMAWQRGEGLGQPASTSEPSLPPDILPLDPLPPEPPPQDTPEPIPEDQRQAVSQDLETLQADLSALDDRLQALEEDLEGAPQSGPLEERLQRLVRRLDPDAPVLQSADQSAVESDAPAATAASAPTPVLAPPPNLSANTLRVTLPSDELFQDNEVRLRAGATALLDTIVSELQTYPAATIRISVHTAAQRSPTEDLILSLARSQTIRDAIAPQVGPSYRLVAVGYGSSRPLSLSSDPQALQRNRRVEITIDPRL